MEDYKVKWESLWEMYKERFAEFRYYVARSGLWKQSAKMLRTYGIDNWISREYFRGLWNGSQALADRRLKLLRRYPEFVWDDEQGAYFCPICGANSNHGHLADCELIKELADGD